MYEHLVQCIFVVKTKRNAMKKQRNVMRLIHLLGAGAIGTYIYAPVENLEWVRLAMQLGVIPILSLSGMWLWKPQWFRFRKVVIWIGLLLYLIGNPIASSAQRGGLGSFYLGYKNLDTEAFDYFSPEGAPSLGSAVLQVGGEGHFLLNRILLGGGGHYSRGDRFDFGSNAYELDGGGGYLSVGYTAIRTPRLLLFPFVNVGIEAMGLTKSLDADIAFEPGRFTEITYSVVTPTFDLGIGADWLSFGKGFKLGARIGYQFALDGSPQWRHARGNEVLDTSAPNAALDGFYIRLSVGGGYFSQ